MGSDREKPYDLVRTSFGPSAARYTTSAAHADPAALSRFVAMVAPEPHHRVLDVATGAGHTALALASEVRTVVAVDVTREMLAEARRNAHARGVAAVAFVQGAAESLPFATASFDRVVCRIAAHHFPDPAAAVREMARVLDDGGRAAILDTTVPEDDDLDREINAVERLRDPSHVRNWRASEWRALLEAAGLRVTALESGIYDREAKSFNDWTARIRTPPAAVAELRRMLSNARPALRAALELEVTADDIRLALPRVVIVAVK